MEPTLFKQFYYEISFKTILQMSCGEIEEASRLGVKDEHSYVRSIQRASSRKWLMVMAGRYEEKMWR